MKRVKVLFRYIWSIIKWFLAFIKWIIVDKCILCVWVVITIPYIYFGLIYCIATPDISYEDCIHKYANSLNKSFKLFGFTDGEKIAKEVMTIERWGKYRITD